MSNEEHNYPALKKELDALEEFLNSDGYKVAKHVTDAEIQDGIDFLVDAEIANEADLWKVLEARGEVRALKKFTNRFTSRIDEIKQILDSEAKPLDD